MKRPASPVDIFLGQVSGVLFGLLAAVAVFVVPVWASRSWESWPWACVSVLVLPALGFLLGTCWGSRPQQDGDRRKGRR
jgi:protein-S-isoprenylcysteine O-methyltransferase Ste14